MDPGIYLPKWSPDRKRYLIPRTIILDNLLVGLLCSTQGRVERLLKGGSTFTTTNLQQIVFEQVWDFYLFLKQPITEIQHLQYNKIRVEGAKNMAEALSINNTLTTLHLAVRFVYFLNKANLKLTISLKFNTGQWNWRWRSKEHGRSIVNQQHIDNIAFGGEICLFFETSNLEIDDFIEIQHSQNNFIGVEGAKNMAEALSINNTLTTLHLRVRFVYFLEQSILKLTILLKFNTGQ